MASLMYQEKKKRPKKIGKDNFCAVLKSIAKFHLTFSNPLNTARKIKNISMEGSKQNHRTFNHICLFKN